MMIVRDLMFLMLISLEVLGQDNSAVAFPDIGNAGVDQGEIRYWINHAMMFVIVDSLRYGSKLSFIVGAAKVLVLSSFSKRRNSPQISEAHVL